MKIVKQFESNDFAKRRSPGMNSPLMIPQWSWGLGEDGELYCKGQITGFIVMEEWYAYSRASFGIPSGEMKKIIKEFGHLLIFT